jgi:hypothetical protein
MTREVVEAAREVLEIADGCAGRRGPREGSDDLDPGPGNCHDLYKSTQANIKIIPGRSNASALTTWV